MRTPSRRMPPAPERPTLGPMGTTLFLSILAAGLVALGASYWPMSGAVAAGLIPLFWAAAAIERDRVRRLAADRQGESICTFARSLDFRSIDTWIIRAVYEELQALCPNLPIRASDRFAEEIAIDEEDLEELIADVAFRSRRSVEEAEINPLFGQVGTVRDLVLFLNQQPRVQAT